CGSCACRLPTLSGVGGRFASFAPFRVEEGFLESKMERSCELRPPLRGFFSMSTGFLLVSFSRGAAQWRANLRSSHGLRLTAHDSWAAERGHHLFGEQVDRSED